MMAAMSTMCAGTIAAFETDGPAQLNVLLHGRMVAPIAITFPISAVKSELAINNMDRGTLIPV